MGVCGDNNLDGEVDPLDATLILQFYAAMIDSLNDMSNADVDNSGSITSVDAALILQASAGIIDVSDLTCP